MEKTEFIPVDLHIHTPASKCYKINSETPHREEYINIIKNYHSKNIKVIAITDHNTIKGYKEIMHIKSEVNQTIKTLVEFESDSEKIADKIAYLKTIQIFFQEILILPGVEFEATPGIHLLFIFDPDRDLDRIEQFLIESGYSDKLQGIETTDSVTHFDVLEALKKAKELGALTIAAHADSNKGIYNDLKGGYRTKVFKSEDLDAISLNNTVNIDKIKELLTQPEYKRSKPIAYIQSSDHHHMEECGKRLTYISMPDLSFKSLTTSFQDPSSQISATAKPEIRNIITQIANDKNTIAIESIDLETICQASSAILNNNYGVVIIGVNNNKYKNIKGVDASDEQIRDMTESIIRSISPDKIYYRIKTHLFNWGEKKVIAILIKNISNKTFLCKGKHYSVQNQKAVESSTSDLLNISLQRFSILDEFQENHYKKLELLTEQLQIISEQKHAINVIETIELNSVSLSAILKLKLLDQSSNMTFSKIDGFGNSEGNTYIIHETAEIRASDYYERCTCYIDNRIDFNEEDSLEGQSILIIPGGASYFITNEKKYNIYNNLEFPLVHLVLESDFKELSLYPIISWLKSSVFLWYSHTVFGSCDIYIPSIFDKIKIPTCLFEADTSAQLEIKIRQIMDIEREFLQERESENIDLICDNNEDSQEEYFLEKSRIHNRKIDIIAKEIDDIINSKLCLNDEKNEYLNNFLILSDYHTLSTE